MSRSVWLRRGHERDELRNDETLLGSSFASFVGPFLGPERHSPPTSFGDLFRAHYPTLRGLVNGHPEPGLALIAASPSGVEAAAWFEAKEGDVNPIIVGRHTAAEIFLPSDPALSLRHLAVLVHRRQGSGPVGFRVLDLRAPTPFTDEQGHWLQSVEAEGPVMIHCASLGLMLFPTEAGGASWPESPDEAWQKVPERVYVQGKTLGRERGPIRGAQRWRVEGELSGARPAGQTLVGTLPGPVIASAVASDSGRLRGELRLDSHLGRASVKLGARALEQGVLIGRYERCDTAGVPLLSVPSLSRVHLLVIEIDGALHAVDTASTNGTSRAGRRVRSTRLETGAPVLLAGHTSVVWEPVH